MSQYKNGFVVIRRLTPIHKTIKEAWQNVGQASVGFIMRLSIAHRLRSIFSVYKYAHNPCSHSGIHSNLVARTSRNTGFNYAARTGDVINANPVTNANAVTLRFVLYLSEHRTANAIAGFSDYRRQFIDDKYARGDKELLVG